MHRRTLLGAVVAGVVVFGTARAGGKPKAAGPKVVVHKDPYCGCCSLWVEHMRQAGFAVEVRDTDALDAVKARLGVPTVMIRRAHLIDDSTIQLERRSAVTGCPQLIRTAHQRR